MVREGGEVRAVGLGALALARFASGIIEQQVRDARS